MKTVSADVHIKGIGDVIASGEYHIDPGAVGHIIGILQTLYSKPVAAVIREYLTNAIDVHVATGATKKITVHLPTTLEPYYSVRDRGGGLTEADTIKHLYGVGSSSELKRQSNDQIGGFGVGAKCGYAVTNSFTYTVWHGGQKRVWSCEKDVRDKPVYKLIFQEPSDEDAGIEVMIPLPETKFSTYTIKNAVVETIPFVGHRDLLEFTESQYVIPPEPKPITSITRRMKFNGIPECDIEFGLYPVGALAPMNQRLPAVMTCAACYDIDTQVYSKLLDAAASAHLSAYSKKRSKLSDLLGGLGIKVPTGVLQLSPSRETLQYSPHTTTVLEGIINEFLSDEFQQALAKQVTEELKTSTIIDRVTRLSMFKLPSESKKDWVTSGSLMIPYSAKLRTAILNASQVNTPGSVDVSTGCKIDKPAIDAYASSSVFNGPSVVTPNSNIGYVKREPVVVLTNVEDAYLADDRAVREFGKRVLTYLLKMEPRPSAMANGYIELVILGTTDENVVPWLKDGSLPFVKIEGDLPAVDDTLFYNRPQHQYRGHTTRVVSYAKAIGTQAFTLKKDGPSDKGTNSSWWEPVKWKNVKQMTGVFVTTKLFSVDVGHKWSSVQPGNFLSWVDLVKASNGAVILPDMFSDGEAKIYAVRCGTPAGGKAPATKMLEAGFKSLWTYIATRFKEDVKSGHINLDLLFHSIMEMDSPKELRTTLDVVSKSVFAKSKAGELLVEYNNRIKVNKKVETATKAWAAVICGLGETGCSAFSDRIGPAGTAILSAEVNGTKLFDISDGTGVCKTWISTQSPRILTGWTRFSAIASEVPEVRNPVEEIIRKVYDDIPLARVILPISNCCDTRSDYNYATLVRHSKTNEFELDPDYRRSRPEFIKKYSAEEQYVTEDVIGRFKADNLFQQYITGSIDKVNDAATTKP